MKLILRLLRRVLGVFRRRDPDYPVLRFTVTDPDGIARQVELHCTPDMEDVPLEDALGLKPGSRFKLRGEE